MTDQPNGVAYDQPQWLADVILQNS
jgi:hypothetical protein